MRGFDPATLSALRQRQNLSRGELARAAGVGTATLYAWEVGTKSPQVDLLAKVAAALNVAIEELVNIDVKQRFPGDWRVLRGLTQPQLGALAGVSTAVVGRVERGEGELIDTTAKKLAGALGLDVDEFRAAHTRARNRPLGEPA